MDTAIVVGIDGGGTFSRAVAVDLTGRMWATAVGGAASPHKTPHAQENVRRLIEDVVEQAHRRPADVAALVAGLAGLDAPEDHVWAERFTALPGLACPRRHVNDAVVAHAGAFGSEPGVIAISGTGSNVFGVAEDGRPVGNGDFRHYAHTSARHLAFDAVYEILAGRDGAADAEFVSGVLAFWEVPDMQALRVSGAEGFIPDGRERSRRFGEMGPLVTAAAPSSPLAGRVCDRAADVLAQGIELVGGCFTDPEVSVALIGGVARGAYMGQAVAEVLARGVERQYQIVEPRFSCAEGAALMALKIAGVPVNDSVRARITQGD